jgi:hypothetical protein
MVLLFYTFRTYRTEASVLGHFWRDKLLSHVPRGFGDMRNATGRIPGRNWYPACLLSTGHLKLFPQGQKSWTVQQPTHLSLGIILKMRGVLLPLMLCSVVTRDICQLLLAATYACMFHLTTLLADQMTRRRIVW